MARLRAPRLREHRHQHHRRVLPGPRHKPVVEFVGVAVAPLGSPETPVGVFGEVVVPVAAPGTTVPEGAGVLFWPEVLPTLTAGVWLPVAAIPRCAVNSIARSIGMCTEVWLASL